MPQQELYEIKYTDTSLSAKFGVAPIKVGRSLAEQYEKMGIAKIVGKRPESNPSLPPETSQSTMPEDRVRTKITWVSSIYPDNFLKKVGENLGFIIELQTPPLFSLGKMLQGELILVEYPLKSFSSNQVTQLKGILFQKKVPYIFRVADYNNDSEVPFFLAHSKLNIFKTDLIFEEAREIYGDFENWWIEHKEASPHDFWKEIDKVVNPGNYAKMAMIERMAESLDRRVMDSALEAGYSVTNDILPDVETPPKSEKTVTKKTIMPYSKRKKRP